ncbi:hypothetical protein RESH_04982 [Rhodopirellula europaea SH398]|uniref:Uncharacterized protein n=1 Tax=Rhodopirellula europaea SH398 TaxID=1263868 RepID=M5RZG4_9BACT|nr:hypothetical protein RESH_04982 [Rhodopirellula europaea SH398]
MIRPRINDSRNGKELVRLTSQFCNDPWRMPMRLIGWKAFQ